MTGFLVGVVTKLLLFFITIPATTHGWLFHNSNTCRYPKSTPQLLFDASPQTITTSTANTHTDDTSQIFLENYVRKNEKTFRILDGVSIMQISDRERGVTYIEPQQQEITPSSISSFRPGTELAFVSSSEFITSSYGRKTSLGKALSKYLKQQPELLEKYKPVLNGMYIGIYLVCIVDGLIDPTQNVRMTSYLPTLPTLMDMKQHMPIFWSCEELNELQNSRVRNAIERRQRKWKEEYDLLLNVFSSLRSSSSSDDDDDDDAVATTISHRFVSLETYIWARSIVLSRTFASPSYGPCLVPFIDMLNHNADDYDNERSFATTTKKTTSITICCDYHIDRNGFSLTVPLWLQQEQMRTPSSNIDRVQVQEEMAYSLEISYGRMSNGELLLSYGFTILNDHSQDMKEIGFLTLDLEHNNDVDLTIQQVWDNGMSWDDNDDGSDVASCNDGVSNSRVLILRVGGDDGIDSTLCLFSICRFVSSSLGNDKTLLLDILQGFLDVQLQNRKNISTSLVPEDDNIDAGTFARQPISIANEIGAMKYLQRAICNELAAYPTSLWEDEDLLLFSSHQDGHDSPSTNAQSENLRNAIIVRRGEKRVLHHFYNVASWAIKVLSDDDVTLEDYKQLLDEQLNKEEVMYLTNTFSTKEHV